MVQLIVGGVALPQTSNDKYSCYPDLLASQVDMISGRRVQEVRGNVQKISYAYDTLDNETWIALQAVLRSGLAFNVSYLPDNSNEMISSLFLTESISPPKFGFARNNKAVWHNISFTLREVKPHD